MTSNISNTAAQEPITAVSLPSVAKGNQDDFVNIAIRRLFEEINEDDAQSAGLSDSLPETFDHEDLSCEEDCEDDPICYADALMSLKLENPYDHEILTKEEGLRAAIEIKRAQFDMITALITVPSSLNRVKKCYAALASGNLSIYHVIVRGALKKQITSEKNVNRLSALHLRQPAVFIAEQCKSLMQLQNKVYKAEGLGVVVSQDVRDLLQQQRKAVAELLINFYPRDPLLQKIAPSSLWEAMRQKPSNIYLRKDVLQSAVQSYHEAKAQCTKHKNFLFDHNQRFVRYMSSVILRKFPDHPELKETLISCGNEGLVIAVTDYDHERDTNFITYGSWWVRQRMFAGIMKEFFGKSLSSEMQARLNEYHKILKAYVESHGDKPSEAYLMETMKTLPKQESDKKRVLMDLQLFGKPSVSLNHPLNGDDGLFFELTYEKSKGPEQQVIRKDLNQKLINAMENLSPREKDVLVSRFAITGPDAPREREEETLEMIGKRYNISRERVRQIEVQALKKMKAALTLKRESFLNERHPTHSAQTVLLSLSSLQR